MAIPPDATDASRLIADLRLDEADDERYVNLCAYDNVLSRTAAGFLQSPLSQRYRLGSFDPQADPQPCKQGLVLRLFSRLDSLESAAHAASLALFGGVAADLRPLSGVHATLSLLLALTEPGDAVYSIDPAYGGHFATRHIVERAGRRSHYLAWDAARHSEDLAGIEVQFKQQRPTYILLDHGSPLRPLDVAALRERAGAGAVIDFDASHSLGLIAGGLFQSPLHEGCDILHGNTHKSFPGPQKGLVVFNDQGLARRFQASLDAGLVSSLHTHHLAALCVTLLEMRQWARPYAQRMLRNAWALRRALAQRGFDFEQPADQPQQQSHVLLIKTPGPDAGYAWFERLRQAWIAINVRPLFGQTLMRLGVQEVTRRGWVEAEMALLAAAIAAAIRGDASEAACTASQIGALHRTKTDIRFSFDDLALQDGAGWLPTAVASSQGAAEEAPRWAQ